MNKIPKDPAWCSYCKQDGKNWGDNNKPPGSPCQNHTGPNGEKVHYHGDDAYEPSEYILEMVGMFFNAWDGNQYICTGFDPRHGFWVKSLVDGAERNISNHAIHRTYHPIREYHPKYSSCMLAWLMMS